MMPSTRTGKAPGRSWVSPGLRAGEPQWRFSRPAASLRTTRTKPWGPGQEAPLTAEYQKVYEESLADQANGGEGNFFDHSARCMPGGMPLITIAFGAMEYIVTPETTYIATGGGEAASSHIHRWARLAHGSRPQLRLYAGYSIGRWIDEDGTGHYTALEVRDARPLQGPPAPTTQPACRFIFDNQSIFKERIFPRQGRSNNPFTT